MHDQSVGRISVSEDGPLQQNPASAEAPTAPRMIGADSLQDHNLKKQMEFKNGKLTSYITDQEMNSNRVFLSRYSGALGVLYFVTDTIVNLENLLAICVLILI